MDRVTKLRALAQLDVDAMAAYDAAIARVAEPMVRRRLDDFRTDHARHVQHLNALIQHHGGTPVALRPDLRGAAMRGITALSSLMGTEAALLAMLANEEVTHRAYDTALLLDWSPEERALILRHHADEERHATWIKDAVRHRPWQPGHALGSEAAAPA